MPVPRRPPLASVAYLLVGVVLAVGLTWPMPLHPVSTIVGLPQTTGACHLWVLWWAREHLVELDSPLLFYPNGGDVMRLYGSDVLSPLLLRWIPLPEPLLYNGWVLGLLTVGGLGAARLALRAGAGIGGSWVALAVFEAAPFFQHELLNGTVELLGASFLPWFVIAMLDVLDAPSWGAGARAGAWGLAAAWCSIYNLFFLALLGSVLLVHRAATTAEALLNGPRLRALALGVAIGGAGLGALGGVHLLHGASETLTERETVLEQEPPAPDAFADLSAWLDPSPAEIPAVVPLPHGEVFEYWTTATVHLGFVAVGLALFGVLRPSGRRDVAPGPLGSSGAVGPSGAAGPSGAPWVLLVIVGVLVASGPWLRVGGEKVGLLDGPIPMPALTLSAMVPAFSVTAPHTYRYASLVVLGLAVLAARGVRGVWAGRAFAALIAVESLLLSPLPRPTPVTSVPESAVLDALAGMADGAVLTAPTEADNLYDLGRAMLAQTVHGRPFQDGGMHHRAGEASVALFHENALVEALAARGTRRLPALEPTLRSLGELEEVGYGYLLVAVEEEDVDTWARETLGPPDLADDIWALWRLARLPDAPEREKESP